MTARLTINEEWGAISTFFVKIAIILLNIFPDAFKVEEAEMAGCSITGTG